MELYRVQGGACLTGHVHVAGAKNSALKLMAAALLAPGTTSVTNVPRILDVPIMGEVLRRLGCTVALDGAAVSIDVPDRPGSEADYDLVRRMRAAICVLGPLLARTGEAKVAMPGGDAIGSRGLDLHIKGLTDLGAEVSSEHGYVIARASRLKGASVWLGYPSVGATENLLMAAVLAKGSSVIDNAACEPEIVDLCTMLTRMGAQIGGIGTSTLEVDGVETLYPVAHETVGDRIVGGTFAIAATMTRGDVTVHGVDPANLRVPLDKLSTAGAQITAAAGGFTVRMDGRPRCVDVVTLPYPGFPTDLQPLAIALASVSDGTSMVTENVFDARLMFVNELLRLGADLRTDGHHVQVLGRAELSGAPVRATDIRAGAGLVLAGLCAQGYTEVGDIFHVERGYPDLVGQLVALGAGVERIDRPDPVSDLHF